MDNFAKLVALALLTAAPVSHAASSANLPFQNFMRTALGAGSQTVSFSGNGTPVPAVKGTDWGNAPGTQTGNNYFVRPQPDGGAHIGTNGSVPVGKHNVPVTLTGSATKSALAAGMKTTFMAVGRVAGPLGMAFTALELIDYMTSNDVKENPDKSDPSKPFILKKPIEQIQYQVGDYSPWFGSKAEACSNANSKKNAQEWTSSSMVSALQYCTLSIRNTYPPATEPAQEYSFAFNTRIGTELKDFPASLSDIEPYLTRPAAVPLPDFIDATEKIRTAHPNAGIDPFKVDLQWERASGPATLPSSEPTITSTTKVNPDGSTTVTTTRTAGTPTVTYTGNEVKVTEKEVTSTETTTCTQTATCTTTKTEPDTETTKPATEETDLCKLHPDILACVKVTEAGELEPVDIPNAEKIMQITPDQGWGPSGGTCPAPKTATIMGVNLVMPFTLLCDFATAIRPLLIAFAWLSAALTFFGLGRKD